jgi:hypothetical protein
LSLPPPIFVPSVHGLHIFLDFNHFRESQPLFHLQCGISGRNSSIPAASTLMRVMGDHRVDDPDVKVSIVYPNRQFLPAKTRTFVDHTLEHFGRTVSNVDDDAPMPAAAQTPPPVAGAMSTSLHAPRDV